MSKLTYFDNLDVIELRKLLDDVPNDLKLDIVQLALDLAGIVNPVADAASAFISLMRGDLLGAAIGAVSIIPIGDIAKLGKFQKYRKSLTRVVDAATKSPRLALAIEPAIKQLDGMLNSIKGFMGNGNQTEWFRELDQMRAAIRRYQQYIYRVKLIRGRGVGKVARSNGISAGQFAIRRGDRVITANVDQVVELLEESAGLGRHPAIKNDAKELLNRMAMSNRWQVSAGPHAKGQVGSNTMDATTHITVRIEGDTSYHLRMDKRGHLFQVTDSSGRGISGIDPWSSPGSR